MDISISQILKENVDAENFKAALSGKGGSFEFNTDAMVEFGETYCSLYPESLTHSDSAGVVTGYRLVRICVLEILITQIPADLREDYRKMFADVHSINSVIPDITAAIGIEKAFEIHNTLDETIKKIKSDIDFMPHSVSKERFIGGISVFFNILYLMKKKLQSKE